MSNSFDMV